MTFFTSRSLLKVCGLGVFVSMPLHAQTTTLSQLAALTQATFSNGRDATWRAADRAITGGYASPEASAAPMFGAEFGSTRVPLGSSRLQTVTTAAAHKVNATTVAGLAIGYSPSKCGRRRCIAHR
jgi:hypothetical protein